MGALLLSSGCRHGARGVDEKRLQGWPQLLSAAGARGGHLAGDRERQAAKPSPARLVAGISGREAQWPDPDGLRPKLDVADDGGPRARSAAAAGDRRRLAVSPGAAGNGPIQPDRAEPYHVQQPRRIYNPFPHAAAAECADRQLLFRLDGRFQHELGAGFLGPLPAECRVGQRPGRRLGGELRRRPGDSAGGRGEQLRAISDRATADQDHAGQRSHSRGRFGTGRSSDSASARRPNST